MTLDPPFNWQSGQVSAEQLAAAERLSAEQQSVQELYFSAQRSRKELGPEAAEIAFKGFLESSAAYKARLADFNRTYGPFGNPEPITDAQVSSLILLGELAEQEGRLSVALDYYDAAENLAATELSPLGRINAELRLANARASAGRFHSAISTIHNARAQLDSPEFNDTNDDKVQELRFDLTNRLAEIYDWLGDLERAEEELQLAEELVRPAYVAENLPDVLGGLDPMSEEGIARLTEIATTVSREMTPGQTEEAKAFLAALQGLQGQTTLSHQQLSVKLRRGLLAKKLGRLDEAWEVFDEIAPAYTAMGEAAGLGIEYQLAAVEREMGRPATASERIDKVISGIDRNSELRWKAGQIFLVRAECHRDLGNYPAAYEAVEHAIDALESSEQRDSLWKAYWLQAQLLGRDSEASLEAYDRAIAIIDELRQAPLGFRLDNAYLRDKLPLIEEALLAAAEQGDAVAAFRFMEAAKSRALMTLLSVPPGDLEDELSIDPLSAEIDALSREIDALEWQAFAGEEPSVQREDLIARRQTLLERKLIADPRWRTLREPRAFNLQSFQKILAGKNLSALNLFLIDDTIVAVLITSASATVVRHELSKKAHTSLQRYDKNMRRAQPNPLLQDPLEARLKVTSFLPDEILDQALDTNGLVISPHRELHLIPWAGLPLGQDRLFDHTAVSILPNLSCLPILATPEDKEVENNGPVALFGPPDYEDVSGLKNLPQAQIEIDEIAEIYVQAGNLAAEPISGKAADELAFWNLLSDHQPDILHVCCHADASSDAPMTAGLICVEGKVDAAEISAGLLPCTEVVLSACSTGFRPTSVGNIELHGDDILGLPGSFLEAGVSTILVSIPPAEDAAARAFTVHYHTARIAGKSPIMAYQDTQKFMVSEGKFDPMSWVGFVLYGGF